MRIIATFSSGPKVGSNTSVMLTSPSPSPSMAPRYCATSTGSALWVRIVVPPLKSMPKFSPWNAKEPMATRIITPEIPSQIRHRLKKSSDVSRGTRRSMRPCRTDFGRLRSNQMMTISRVTKSAVNTEVMIPSPSVMAKPRTGPDPIA